MESVKWIQILDEILFNANVFEKSMNVFLHSPPSYG